MRVVNSISGLRFGRLIAVEFDHSKNHKCYWRCRFDCGNEIIVRRDQLTTGKTKSCGCLCNETRHQNMKHGGQKPIYADIRECHPRLWRIWRGMKNRCYYSKHVAFKNYGGRGIKICDEWRKSFRSFAKWALSNGYNDTLSIDRIDVDGNYSPNNCRWATAKEQSSNTRKRKAATEGQVRPQLPEEILS